MTGARPAAATGALPSSAEETVKTRARPRRGRWFALGIVVGGIAALVARGEGSATLHDVREWSARALRSLAHKGDHLPRTEAPASTASRDTAEVVATASVKRPPARPAEAPCPIDPSPDDPCAELLAPFLKPATSTPIPTYSVDDLPRVKPLVVTVVARRHHHGRAAPAAVAQADADTDDDTPAQAPAGSAPPAPEVVASRPVPIFGSDEDAR